MAPVAEELLQIEFTLLQKYAPVGMYILPPQFDDQAASNGALQVQQWNCLYVVKEGTGPYGGAIIKFQVRVQLANYPRHRPRVFFDEGVKLFHPLVDSLTNEMKMLLEWKEDSNWLIDVLLYVKKAFHLKELMDVDKS